MTTNSKTNNMTIDPVAVEFIAWAMDKIEDEVWFQEFRQECIERLTHFLSRDPSELRTILRNKLERGSRDHGSPLRKQWDIEQELQDEYIDILGWPLVGLFRDHYDKRGV